MKTYNFFYFIIVMGLSSCAIHQGYFTSSTSIQDANFRTIRPVYGSSNAIYIFGIGGLSTDRLIFEAKEDLYNNASLRNNQILANITVDNKYLFLFPIYFQHKVFLSADIIEFPIADDKRKFSNLDTVLIDKSSTYTNSSQLIKIGSQVKFSDLFGIKYIGIVTKVDKDAVEVEYNSGLGGIRKTVLKIKDIIPIK